MQSVSPTSTSAPCAEQLITRQSFNNNNFSPWRLDDSDKVRKLIAGIRYHLSPMTRRHTGSLVIRIMPHFCHRSFVAHSRTATIKQCLWSSFLHQSSNLREELTVISVQCCGFRLHWCYFITPVLLWRTVPNFSGAKISPGDHHALTHSN